MAGYCQVLFLRVFGPRRKKGKRSGNTYDTFTLITDSERTGIKSGCAACRLRLPVVLTSEFFFSR